MNIRRILAIVGALAVLAGISVYVLMMYAPEVTLEFSEAQLQEQLGPRFPAKQCLLSACLELTDPKLRLLDKTDRAEMAVAFTAVLGNRTMPGTAVFSGQPTYDKGTGNFYLRQVRVSEFAMSGNAPDFDEVVKKRGPGLLAAIIDRTPIYSIGKHPKYGSVARLALRSIRVESGKLRVVFANPLLLFGKQG